MSIHVEIGDSIDIVDGLVSLRATGSGETTLGTATLELEAQGGGGLSIINMMEVRVYRVDDPTGHLTERIFGGFAIIRNTSNIATTKTWTLDCQQYSLLLDTLVGGADEVDEIVVDAGTFRQQVQSATAQVQAFGTRAGSYTAIDTDLFVANLHPEITLGKQTFRGKSLREMLQAICVALRLVVPAVYPRLFIDLGDEVGAVPFGGPYLKVYDRAATPAIAARFSDAPVDEDERYMYPVAARKDDSTGQRTERELIWGEGKVNTGAVEDAITTYPNPYSNTRAWRTTPLTDSQVSTNDEAQALVDRAALASAYPRESVPFVTNTLLRPGQYVVVTNTLEGWAGFAFEVAAATGDYSEPLETWYSVTLGARPWKLGEKPGDDILSPPEEFDRIPPHRPIWEDTPTSDSWLLENVWDDAHGAVRVGLQVKPNTTDSDIDKYWLRIVAGSVVLPLVPIDARAGGHQWHNLYLRPATDYIFDVQASDQSGNVSRWSDTKPLHTPEAVTQETYNWDFRLIDPTDPTLPDGWTRIVTGAGTAILHHFIGIESYVECDSPAGGGNSAMLRAYKQVVGQGDLVSVSVAAQGDPAMPSSAITVQVHFYDINFAELDSTLSPVTLIDAQGLGTGYDIYTGQTIAPPGAWSMAVQGGNAGGVGHTVVRMSQLRLTRTPVIPVVVWPDPPNPSFEEVVSTVNGPYPRYYHTVPGADQVDFSASTDQASDGNRSLKIHNAVSDGPVAGAFLGEAFSLVGGNWYDMRFASFLDSGGPIVTVGVYYYNQADAYLDSAVIIVDLLGDIGGWVENSREAIQAPNGATRGRFAASSLSDGTQNCVVYIDNFRWEDATYQPFNPAGVPVGGTRKQSRGGYIAERASSTEYSFVDDGALFYGVGMDYLGNLVGAGVGEYPFENAKVGQLVYIDRAGASTMANGHLVYGPLIGTIASILDAGNQITLQSPKVCLNPAGVSGVAGYFGTDNAPMMEAVRDSFDIGARITRILNVMKGDGHYAQFRNVTWYQADWVRLVGDGGASFIYPSSYQFADILGPDGVDTMTGQQQQTANTLWYCRGFVVEGIQYVGSYEKNVYVNNGPALWAHQSEHLTIDGCKLQIQGGALLKQDKLALDNHLRLLNSGSYGARNNIWMGNHSVVRDFAWELPNSATDSSYDRSGDNGSSHAFYQTAGSIDILFERVNVLNGRAAGIKASGSDASSENITINQCQIEQTNTGVELGGDDLTAVNIHRGFTVQGCLFKNNLVSVQMYGVVGAGVFQCEFLYNQNATARGQTTASVHCINIVQFNANTVGAGQPVVGITLSGNRYIGGLESGEGTSPSALMATAVLIKNAGQGSARHGSVKIRNEQFFSIASTALNTTQCIGLDIDDSAFNNMSVAWDTNGDASPRFGSGNSTVAGPNNSGSGAMIRIDKTTFPTIEVGHNAGKINGINVGGLFTISKSGGTAPYIWSDRGIAGIATNSEGKPEVVWGFGAGHIQGDYMAHSLIDSQTAFSWFNSTVELNDVTTTAGNNTFTSASHTLTANDRGKPVVVAFVGATPSNLWCGYITAITGTGITLDTVCTTGATNRTAIIGTSRTITDMVIAAGGTAVTSATANWTQADVGKYISWLEPAGESFTLRFDYLDSVTDTTHATLHGSHATGTGLLAQLQLSVYPRPSPFNTVQQFIYLQNSLPGYTCVDRGIYTSGLRVIDGAMSLDSTTLSSPSLPFLSPHVGMAVLVPGAAYGGAALTAIITGYTDTGHVVLSRPARTAVTNAVVQWGDVEDHGRIRFNTPTTVANKFSMWSVTTNPTALVVLPNGSSANFTKCFSRGELTTKGGSGDMEAGGWILKDTGGITSPGDIGRAVSVPGAGPSGATLTSTIISIISSHAWGLADTATTAVTGVAYTITLTPLVVWSRLITRYAAFALSGNNLLAGIALSKQGPYCLSRSENDNGSDLVIQVAVGAPASQPGALEIFDWMLR